MICQHGDEKPSYFDLFLFITLPGMFVYFWQPFEKKNLCLFWFKTYFQKLYLSKENSLFP